MKHLKLDRLPWIDVPPYDQILTKLVSSCQQHDVGLICVQGPNGSGKSRILTELLSTLSFDATASLIALSGRDNEVFYHNVQLSSELLDLKNPQFIHNFTLTLEAILKDKQHFYILIDDVEALSYELMYGITNVIAENPGFKKQVTLVVFMGVMPIHIETRRLLRGAEMVTLKGMSIMEVKQFVDRVFQHAYLKQEKTLSEVNQLHSLSYGYVGRLIKLLENKVILDQKPIKASAQKNSINVIVFSCITLLVIFGALAWLLLKPNEVTAITAVEAIPEPKVIKVEPIPFERDEIIVKVVEPVTASQNITEAVNIEEPLLPIKVLTPLSSHPHDVGPMQPMETEVPIVNIEQVKAPLHYVIELGRNHSKRQLEESLKGRSIPGKAQFKQIQESGKEIWVAYIGPYSSEKHAVEGKNKLPASLQRLPLRVNKEF